MTEADLTPPTLIRPHNRALPLLTLTELRIARIASRRRRCPQHTLMDRAGKAAASFLLERITRDTSVEKSRQRVWLIAGPGNNGGDALMLAAELHKAGIAVEVCMPVEVKPDDARWALDTARAAGVAIATAPPASLDGYSWLVDGMFGIGLARPLEGVFAAIARQLSQRAQSRPHTGGVLALDVPSGLDSDTGTIVGDGDGTRRARDPHGHLHRREAGTLHGARPRSRRLGDGRADRRRSARARTAVATERARTLRARSCRRVISRPTRARSAASPWSAATPACAARRFSRRARRSTPARARSTSRCSAPAPRPTTRRIPN